MTMLSARREAPHEDRSTGGRSGLTPGQRARFARDGFVTVRDLAPQEEVDFIRATLMQLLAARVGYDEGALFDLLAADGLPSTLPQLHDPASYAPALRATRHRANALCVAQDVLGPHTRLAFEYTILKPARHGAATPWHQDEAFKNAASADYDEISIWMPLQATTPENGCMRYVPGSHRGPLHPHRSPGDDPRVHAIECAEPFDDDAIVYCPLAAGDAVIHDKRTLHGAGSNLTDADRLAYVLMFDTVPRGAPQPGFDWLTEKRTRRAEIRQQWLRRGGWIREISRAISSGRLTHPRRFVTAAARAMRLGRLF